MSFDEVRRLEALRAYAVLDTDPEEDFDRLTRLASAICGVPIALVSLVDAERQWFKSCVGLSARETPRAWAFCDHAIRQRPILEVEDATADPRFADNPLVTGDPNIRFYAGAPLWTPEGLPLGTLCVIDRRPRTLDDGQREALRTLAHQVEAVLELRRAGQVLREREEELRLVNRNRDQLVRFLMHDLRTPLQSASFAITNAQRAPDQRIRDKSLALAARGVAQVQQMLGDLMGVLANQNVEFPLAAEELTLPELVYEVAETASSHAPDGMSVSVSVDLARLHADRQLFTRMVYNLLVNAFRHASGASRVELRMYARGDSAVLEVSDDGPGIPEATRGKIFRVGVSTGSEGQGLGLAFCRAAAKAHGGTIELLDSPHGGALFRVLLPLRGRAANTD